MSKSNATSARLRDAVLDALIRQVDRGEPLINKDTGDILKDFEGFPLFAPVSHQILNTAVAFLKAFPPEELPQSKGLSDKLAPYSQHTAHKV